MSLVQIRDEYGWVTARNGARVATHIAGEGDYYGTITGTRGDLLVVKFDRLSVPQVIGPEQVTYVEEAPDDRWP